MSPVSCVLLFSAFVVGFASGQDAALKRKYLDACRKEYPQANITDVYLSDDYFCVTYCSGAGFFFQALAKKDGSHCKSLYPLDTEARECFGGECQKRSDVNLCMDTLEAPLKSLTVAGCKVSCTSDGDYVVNVNRTKPAGSSCQSTLYWTTSTCDENAVCQDERVYVSDVQGQDASKTPEEKSLATCQERHQKAEVQTYMGDDKCAFLCAYNASGAIGYEYLLYKDGSICDDNSVCLQGQCRSNSFLQECKDAVTGNLISVDDDQCEYICNTETEDGQSLQTTIRKPSGYECKKTPEGGFLEQSGTCDINRVCNLPN